MNTVRSDRFVGSWLESDRPLRRTTITFQRTFNTSPEILLRQLCPTTEYDWLPGWKCELLHSKSGYAEYDAVFKTTFFGPEEVWVCTRYEPGRAIAYTRVSADFCAIFEANLSENPDGTVTATWVETLSALTEQGNGIVAEAESMRERFFDIFDSLDHFVQTGELAD